MKHEKIKEIALEAYEELVKKAVIDLLFPARCLILDNVGGSSPNAKKKGLRGSCGGSYSCCLDYDIYVDDPEYTFSYFFDDKEWSVEYKKLDRDWSSIRLKAKSKGCSFLLVMDDYCDKKYTIDTIEFINDSGERLYLYEIGNPHQQERLYDDGSDGFEFTIDDTSHNGADNANIIMLGYKSKTERLIAEARAMVDDLTIKARQSCPQITEKQ